MEKRVFKRKIYDRILRWKQESNGKSALMIQGARRIGKSTIAEEFAKNEYSSYLIIDFNKASATVKSLFDDLMDLNFIFLQLQTIYNVVLEERKSVIIFDEVQKCPNARQAIKYLVQDGRYDYIETGSLISIKQNTKGITIPSEEEQIDMYPMDFEEFLYANGVGEVAIETMRESFNSNQALSDVMHNKMLDLFKKYLLVGGLPKAVEVFVDSRNVVEFRSVQQEAHSLYGIDASKYEELHDRKLKIRRIYDMIPSNLENKKKRIVINKIEDKSWKRADDYLNEFYYLISAGIALEVKAISKPSYPLVENSGKNLLKLYLNDVGILSGIFYRNNIRAVMSDIRSINLGSVYETVVAQELKAHGYNLYYYDNKKNGEVNYLIDDADNLSNIPIEVKSGKDYTVHSALDKFLANDEYNIKKAYVLSNEQRVYTENGITYIPIYYIMFFRNISNVVEEFLD